MEEIVQEARQISQKRRLKVDDILCTAREDTPKGRFFREQLDRARKDEERAKVLFELQEKYLRRPEESEWNDAPIIRTAREEEAVKPTDTDEPHPMTVRELGETTELWNGDAEPLEKDLNIEVLRAVCTLATGRVGNGKIMANMIRYLQYQAMQRRAGRRKKRKERWKVEMETLTMDQLLCRIPIEDWPTPQGGHSPELVYGTMQEYQRVEEGIAKTTELRDNRYISKNRESPVHLHVARMLGVHLFAEHPPGAWQCPYCEQQRFREYSEWEFHVRQVHLKERIIREEAGDFWTWLFRWIGQCKSWPRVMDVFKKGTTKYTFRRMS
jgi:hypothetical protein